MNLDGVEKAREADFFLAKMVQWEARAFGDREPFDFYLSAFLSAAKSIDYRLRHEQAAYAAWREAWSKRFPSDDKLIKYFGDDRNLEVHCSGSGRSMADREITVHGTYTDKSGTAHVAGPPGMPPATVQAPAYFFLIEGVARKAAEACGEYIAVMKRIVSDFRNDHP